MVERVMSTTIAIKVPGRVYDDYLDPACSSVAAEIGLPKPRRVARAKGTTAIYDGVTIKQAREVADYLHDRGDTLLGESIADPHDPMEKAERNTHRAAIKAAAKIREEARRAELLYRAINAPLH